MVTKICSHCKKEKPTADFNKNSHAKSGLHHQCKECRSVYFVRHKEEYTIRSKYSMRRHREKLRMHQ